MKDILIFLRHVVTPLFLCLFLVLGLTAAMISGVVEYAVVKELFSGNNTEGYNEYIPLVIVIVLEGLKLFLHYAVSAHKRIGDAGRHLVIKNVVKYALVIFSLLCTMIFVSNSLYTPEEVKNITAAQMTAIKNKYQVELELEMKDIESDYENRIKSANGKVESVRSQLQQLTPVYRPRSAYENYIREKLRLESELKEAEKFYNLEYDELIEDKKQSISLVEEKNSVEMQKEIDSLSDNFEYVSSGDNSYLSSALTFAVSIISKENYNRTTYYLCVFGISLIVSIVLELAISFAQFYLSLDESKLNALFGSDEKIPEVLKNELISW